MKKTFLIFLLAAFCIMNFAFTGCGIYSFQDKNPLPSDIKTVYIPFIENEALYRNPQLSPNLTDRLQQKVIRQTKLSPVKSTDAANLLIIATVKDYSVITSGVSTSNGQTQSSINRLTVSVHVTITDQIRNSVREADVSRSFDFPANQTLQQAENALLDEMVRNLSDEIFNRIFSDW